MTILTRPFDHYLKHERLFLLGCITTDRPWISVRRTPMTEHAIYCRVVATTAELLGRPLHPHAFRHAAATSTAEVDPELLGLITRVVVRPGERWVELVVEGALTEMLALGSGSRAEAFAGCSRSSVKLVAGARNHRELTPLTAAI